MGKQIETFTCHDTHNVLVNVKIIHITLLYDFFNARLTGNVFMRNIVIVHVYVNIVFTVILDFIVKKKKNYICCKSVGNENLPSNGKVK